MLADFFAPANLMTTLFCIAMLIAAVVVQYRLSLSSVSVWVRRLPMLICGGGVVFFLILSFLIFSRNPWHALSCFFIMFVVVLLLISCIIGRIAAYCKQRKSRKNSLHEQSKS